MIERETDVDMLKGWNILSIVMFHISTSIFHPFEAQLLGHSWNVSIFFVIAGFFITEGYLTNTKKFILKKVKSLYLPTTIIYLLAVLFHNQFVQWDWYPVGDFHPGNGIPYSYDSILQTIFKCTKVVLGAGSGELVMGAMWFVYTLLYAWIILFILERLIICRISKFINKDVVRFSLFLLLQVMSHILTQYFHLTIPRMNVACTALLLIYLGFLIHQKFKLRYDNIYGFIVAVLLFVLILSFQKRPLILALNQYDGIISLCIGSVSLLYIQGFVLRMITNSFLGRFLALLGRYSLYIMAFHIIGLMIGNSILLRCGIFEETSSKGMYTFHIFDNVVIYILYLFLGIIIPLGITFNFKLLKKGFIRFLHVVNRRDA